jgi:hypothetical protein
MRGTACAEGFNAPYHSGNVLYLKDKTDIHTGQATLYIYQFLLSISYT